MEERLRHLLYRCYKCHTLITKYQIYKLWDKYEKLNKTAPSKVPMALCACGSRMIQPTNAKWWEELFLPRVWVVIWRHLWRKSA